MLKFKKKNIEEKEINPAPNLQELYLPDRVSLREDCVMIDNTFVRVLCVDMLPESIHFGWFASISNMPGVTMAVTAHPYTHEEASKRVAKQRLILGAELMKAQKYGNMQRIDVLNLKHNFYRHLLAEINLHRTNVVSITITIGISATTYQELNEKCIKIQDILGATRASTMYLRQKQGIETFFPNTKAISEYHDVTAANAACLSPLIGFNVTHPSGIFFGRNETGSPCFIDLFIGQPRLYGPHMYIAGMTRSGKSYTVKGIAARSLAVGRRVVILSPDGEYRNLVETMQGTYIRFHPSMPVMFNPFDISPSRDEYLGEYIDIPAKTDDIVSLISSMVEAQSGEKITAEERALAGQAVREEYESLEIFESDPESIYKKGNFETPEGMVVGKSLKEMPTFSSYSERLKLLGANRLHNILKDYCKGGPLGFFDGQTTKELKTESLICFDVSALGNEYSKMYAMYVMLTWLWDAYIKTDDVLTQKHIIIDEAWLFMRFKDTAKFMSELARRGAKYNSSLIAASQSFREFMTEEGQAFLNQCDTKFFLKVQPTDAKGMGELFDMPNNLVERIGAFRQGQGILRMGNESAIVQFQGFPFEEHFLRSDPGAVLVR